MPQKILFSNYKLHNT